MGKILVIGSANVDFVIHAPRMPALGETLTGSDFQTNAGGKGLNQAVAVKKLGGSVSFCGCLGADSSGELLLKTLEAYGIPFAGTRMPGVPTGAAVITVVNGDNFILLSQGANGAFAPEMAQAYEKRIQDGDYVLLQLEIPLETVVKIAEIAHRAGTKVVLNPAPCRELPEELYPLVDYLIPNEHEARILTGISPDGEAACRKAMETLRSRGTGTVIITLGERGCCCDDGEKVRFVPAVPAKVVDTTSAGDTFIGALCSRLAQGETLDEGLRYAVRASAVTVSRSGAACSIPFAEEVL